MLLGSGTKAATGEVETDEAVMFMAVEGTGVAGSAGYQRSGPPRGALNPDLPINGRDLFQFHTSSNPVNNDLVTIELLQGSLGSAVQTDWNQVELFGIFSDSPDQQFVAYATIDASFFPDTDFPLRDRWSFNIPNGSPLLVDGQAYLINFGWNV